MKQNRFFLLPFVFVVSMLMSLQSVAQSTDFSEYTRSFFNQPKTYSVETHGVSFLGPAGMKSYKDGESTFTVSPRAYSYKYKDGSGSSHRIVGELQTVTVLTGNGDVRMQMYVLDNGDAVRAVKYNDGHCAVHCYVKNKASGKYVHNDWFTLRK